MNAIRGLDMVLRDAAALREAVEKQNRRHNALIAGLVAIQQKHRVAKDYAVADEVRALLNSVGVRLYQGTQGHDYADIPKELKGRPVGDTWIIED